MRSTYLLTVILLLALVAGACSNDSKSQQVASLETEPAGAEEQNETSTTDPATDVETGMLAFTQCLRDQGIDVEDPKVNPDGSLQFPEIEITGEVDEEDPDAMIRDFEDRIAPCEQHLEGVVMNAAPGGTAAIEDTLLEYAACMRDNGIDMPDPDLDGNGGVIDLGDVAGSEYEIADAACNHLLADLGLSG
jgi:hypothetical protein